MSLIQNLAIALGVGYLYRLWGNQFKPEPEDADPPPRFIHKNGQRTEVETPQPTGYEVWRNWVIGKLDGGM